MIIKWVLPGGIFFIKKKNEPLSKKNNSIKKLDRTSKYTILQIRHKNGQKTHDKILNITND